MRRVRAGGGSGACTPSLDGVPAGELLLAAPAAVAAAAGAPYWAAIFLYVVIRAGLRKTAAVTFFLGSVTGAIATLYRRDSLSLAASRTSLFNIQQGDPLNFFRPRGFQVLEFTRGGDAPRLVVVHLHANALGGAAHRAAQIQEAAAVAGGVDAASDVILCGDFNCEPGELPGLKDGGAHAGPTWCDRNPLSAGFLRLQDARCDAVLYRLARPDAATVGCAVVLEGPPPTSDHYGVMLEIA